VAELTRSQVTIDRDFVRFDGKSVAVSKINTVEVKARYPYGRHGVMGWSLLATLALFTTFATAENHNRSAAAVALAFVVLFAWLALRAWNRSNIIEYNLFLVTSSQSVQAIKSSDQNVIENLRAQVERAMANQLA
jgi:hypothetical protein